MSHYVILGVDKNASEANIKKAYHKLALVTHPNKGGKEENFKKVVAAYEVLSDEVSRAEYDAMIAPPKPSKKSKTASRSAGGAAGGGGGGAAPLSEANAELLQQINNSRHTVVYNTRNTLRELLQKGLHLRHRTRYQKAQNVLNTLNKRGTSKGSKRRRTRKL
jgi:DnaJ-class molecular chaperone